MTAADRSTLREELKVDEGLRLLPYVDTRGKLSIGYGRNLSDNGITQTEADAMLDTDITRHLSDLIVGLPWVLQLDPPRQIVLANLCFNLGIRKLKGFVKMLAAVQAGNYQLAAVEMMDSDWADQVGARATRLASVMHSGEIK